MKNLTKALLLGYASVKEVPDLIISNEELVPMGIHPRISTQVCSGLFNREDTDS
jgi:hypothetical protein